MKINTQSRTGKILILLLLSPGFIFSQVTVNKGSNISLTPQQFVETYLVGAGITVMNALYNGSAEPLNSTLRVPNKYRDEIGSFASVGGAQTQLGITGGVVLSTGYTNKVVAGNNPNDNMWGNSQPQESDPDLVILAGGAQINDKSVLEFDFIPQTDIVTFRYVFGSIEFDGFCNSINDAFGLFLSGPGIAGGLGFVNDAVNIALLPNTTNYVNIFNICEADQGNLGLGIYSWWNAQKQYYSFNRMTYVFTASYSVQCNQIYHMKFAIGDASDGVLDSGVFLEQNSFTSNNVVSNTSFSNPLTGQLLVEGCNNVSLSYSIPQTQVSNLVITLAIQPSGTATAADITPNPFPSQLVITAGQLNSPSILISPVADGLPEGTETLIIKGTTINSCGLTNEISTTFTLKDLTTMSATLDNQLICDGTSATLTPVISGGQPVVATNSYLYQWSTGATTSSLTLSPPAGYHTYFVTVTDACGQVTSKQCSLDVGSTPSLPGQITGNTGICTPSAGNVYSVAPVTGADSYLWALPTGSVITAGAGTNSITVSFGTGILPGLLEVKGHNNICGDGPATSIYLNINPAAQAAGTITGASVVCQGTESVQYSIDPLNYVYSYDWVVPSGVSIVSGTGTNQISCIFPPGSVSGNLTVSGLNLQCGPGQSSSKAITVNPLPLQAGTITGSSGNEICIPENNVAFQVNSIQYATDYQWIYTGGNVVTHPIGNQVLLDFQSSSTSGNLVVSGVNNCGNGVSSVLSLILKPKPVVDFPSPSLIQFTTKNARPILLRGGTPLGNGGQYIGAGVTEISPGTFIFDPASGNIAGGGSSNPAPYTVSYRYTNVYNCFDEKSFVIKVFVSNAGNPCPGTVKDVRDNKVYSTFLSGTGTNAKCWLAQNLNYGSASEYSDSQSDNFLPEKYCLSGNSSSCNIFGGFYQWDEMMEYIDSPGYQDICPPGWHVPDSLEWMSLINNSLGNGLAGNMLKDLFVSDGFKGHLTGFLFQNLQWDYLAGNSSGSMYWTSKAVTGNKSYSRGINLLNMSTSLYPSLKSNAFAVRCLRN